MRRRTHLARTLAGLLPLLALAACSGDDAGSAGRKVTIYSGRTQNLIEPILDRIATETGIDIDVRYGNSADLALLIAEEGDKTPADVFLSQSPGAVVYLDTIGRLGRLPQDVLDLVPEQWRAADGSWVAFSGRKRVLVAANSVPDAELPTTVMDLTKPEWRGRVGIAPSNASFQDFVTAMRNQIGDEATMAWLRGMADNDAFTFANNNAIVAAVGRREIDVGLVNHYYLYQFLAEDPDFAARNHHFAPTDIGSLFIVTGASAMKGTDNADEAAELVRRLLQEEAQRYFSDQTFEYPVAAGVQPAAVLPPVERVAVEGIELDRLGGDLESTRKLIRDAGLEG
jgi:iron(III) transport system substrate-binding protein